MLNPHGVKKTEKKVFIIYRVVFKNYDTRQLDRGRADCFLPCSSYPVLPCGDYCFVKSQKRLTEFKYIVLLASWLSRL